jgi:hypothetical protein
MSGIFDNLNRQIGHDPSEDDDAGFTALDLRDMPPQKQAVMRLMVREHEMTYADLLDYLGDMPGEMSQADLDAVLIELAREQWIIKFGEENVRYEVNLRKKRESTLAKSIWGTLDSKIEEQRKLREQRLEDSEDEESQG